MQVFQKGDTYFVTATIEEIEALSIFSDFMLCEQKIGNRWGFPAEDAPDHLQALRGQGDVYNWTYTDPTEVVKVLNSLLGSKAYLVEGFTKLV